MKILFDHCTPHGLKDYLPEHEVRTAKDEGLHEVKNGELIRAAVDRGFDVLITADKRMRKQEAISGLPLRVVVLTRPYWPSVRTHAEKIRRAVREAEPGRFTTVRTAQKHTLEDSAGRTTDPHNQGSPARIAERPEEGNDQLRPRKQPVTVYDSQTEEPAVPRKLPPPRRGGRAAAGLSELVTFPKPPPKPRSVERAHIADVLAQVESGTEMAARLHLLHWTGMRPAQMRQLTPDHFVLDHKNKLPHVIVPQGKRGRTALVPLLEEGVAAARKFMSLDAYGEWSTAKANKVLTEAARKAERKRFTTYQIRHSFATALRESGADVADIQYMYGHTNPKTTIIYAPEVMRKNQEAIKRLRAVENQRTETGEDSVDIGKTGSLADGA